MQALRLAGTVPGDLQLWSLGDGDLGTPLAFTVEADGLVVLAQQQVGLRLAGSLPVDAFGQLALGLDFGAAAAGQQGVLQWTSISAVPEPAIAWLLLPGLALLMRRSALRQRPH